MPNKSLPLSKPAALTKAAVFDVKTAAPKVSEFSPAQLESWFASVEREKNSATGTDSTLAKQFLGRFGLINSKFVDEFLKSPGGKSTLTIISEEWAKVESLRDFHTQQHNEEVLRQRRRLVFLMMGLIHKREAHAKHLNVIIQQQIDKKLSDNKKALESGQKTPNEVSLAAIEQTISHYQEAIKALDDQIQVLQQQLTTVNSQLAALTLQGQQMQQRHTLINAQVSQLNNYLQLAAPGQPMASVAVQSQAKVATLTAQIAALKSQSAPAQLAQTTGAVKATTPQQPDIYRDIALRSLEEEVAFLQDLISRPPESNVHIYERSLEHVKKKQANVRQQLDTYAYPEEVKRPYVEELEGLNLQVRGLVHAISVHRGEKILLNENLEQVFTFESARFIVDPSQQGRMVKKGNIYGYLAEAQNLDDLSDDEWHRARKSYERSKYNFLETKAYIKETQQREEHEFAQQKQHYVSIIDGIKTRLTETKMSQQDMVESLSKAKAYKETLIPGEKITPAPLSTKLAPGTSHVKSKAKTAGHQPAAPQQIPEPAPISSYAVMLRGLAPATGPVPSTKQIEKAKGVIREVAAAPQNFTELNGLINEVPTTKLMGEEQRLRWLNRLDRALGIKPDENNSTRSTGMKTRG